MNTEKKIKKKTEKEQKRPLGFKRKESPDKKEKKQLRKSYRR